MRGTARLENRKNNPVSKYEKSKKRKVECKMKQDELVKRVEDLEKSLAIVFGQLAESADDIDKILEKLGMLKYEATVPKKEHEPYRGGKTL